MIRWTDTPTPYSIMSEANCWPSISTKLLFQHPRSPRSMVGVIRHEPGHATHMHVRFVKEQRPDPPNS